MKAYVNEDCIGCGLCEGMCPAVFHMTDANVAEAVGNVPASEVDAAREAQSSCPVGAIVIEEQEEDA